MKKQKTSNDSKFIEWLENSIIIAADAVKNINAQTIDYQVARAELRLMKEVKYTYEKIVGDSNAPKLYGINEKE